MGHADFRVGGRVFASLDADETRGTVKLPPDEQARLCASQPSFTPAAGAWGPQGWTVVHLAAADEEGVGEAVTLSWQLVSTTKPSRARAARRSTTRAATPVDTYIAGCRSDVQPTLRKIQALVRKEVPDAEERISYRMPAFFLGAAVIYFAPFTHHIGVFPPVKGDAALDDALAPYRGAKGNLRFPLDQRLPYALIRRVVRARLQQLKAKPARARRRPAGSGARR